MREIKFRCYDKYTDCMLEWENLVEAGDLKEMLLHGHEEDDNYSKLMQYTGLEDINGNEIYEGDIVHAYTQENDGWISGEITGPIEYMVNSFCIRCEKTNVLNVLWTNAEIYKVIGNIYEESEGNQ